MRFLLVVALVLGPACHAQRSFFAAELGPGTNGPGLRVQGGFGEVGGVTPTLRLAMMSDINRVVDEFEREQDVSQVNIEVGLSATRMVRASERVGVTGGVGLALAFAGRSEEDAEDPIPDFDVPRLEAGLTLPLDVSVAYRVSERVSLSVGGYYSPALTTVGSEDDPELRSQLPGLEQAAAVVGIRVGRW